MRIISTVAPHSLQAYELMNMKLQTDRNTFDCSIAMIHICLYLHICMHAWAFFGYYKFIWSAFAFTRSCMGNVITSPS